MIAGYNVGISFSQDQDSKMLALLQTDGDSYVTRSVAKFQPMTCFV